MNGQVSEMMNERRSRWTADERKISSRSSCCERKRACPTCGQFRLTTVSVDDGDLSVVICDGCQQGFGIDDSMDVETVARLRNEFGDDVVRMTVVTCHQCRNDDVNRFILVDLDRDRQVLRFMCRECSNVSDVPLNDWALASNGPGNDDDMWMPEVLGSVEDDGRESPWSDADSGYAVDDRDVDFGSISCDCGNNEVDCFEEHFDPVSRDLYRVKCLICGDELVLDDAFFPIECDHCGNDTKEVFAWSVDDFGRMTSVRCLACDRSLYFPGQLRDKMDVAYKKRHRTEITSSINHGRTRITDLRDVRRGDHVAWHRWYAIWHHAIVVNVPDDGRSLTVIHNSGDRVKLNGHFASVRLETLHFNQTNVDFHRIDYPAGITQPVDQVVERACSRLGEAKYNPLTNNCEHFARWCKAGSAQSGQVRNFTDRLALVGESAAAKVALEAAGDGVEALAAGSLKTFNRLGTSISQRAANVFGRATSGAVRNVKCGALACNVAVNFGLEAILFTKDVVSTYSKYKSGAISRDEFRQQLAKQGCESLGGLIAGSGFGILLQVLIPIPVLGGLIGCTLGSLLGRFIGAIIGKQIGGIKFDALNLQNLKRRRRRRRRIIFHVGS